MAVTEIIQFGASPSRTVDDTIQKAVKALKGVKSPQQFVLGTQVQDKGAVQITTEWDGIQDYANFAATPEFTSFLKFVSSTYGEPYRIFHVALDRSAFGADGPATANVVEYVQTYFPASRVTPEFQKQVEADFARFDEIYRKGATGGESWAFGWVLEEQEHEAIKDEKAKCFFVTRGWDSMDLFEQSVQNDAYKEAIPLLFAWNAPFKLVGVHFAARSSNLETNKMVVACRTQSPGRFRGCSMIVDGSFAGPIKKF
jgi:ribosomal protein S16